MVIRFKKNYSFPCKTLFLSKSIITLCNFIQLDSGEERACRCQEIVVPLHRRRKERIFKLWQDQTFQW